MSVDGGSLSESDACIQVAGVEFASGPCGPKCNPNDCDLGTMTTIFGLHLVLSPLADWSTFFIISRLPRWSWSNNFGLEWWVRCRWISWSQQMGLWSWWGRMGKQWTRILYKRSKQCKDPKWSVENLGEANYGPPRAVHLYPHGH